MCRQSAFVCSGLHITLKKSNAAYKNGDVGGTCKLALTVPISNLVTFCKVGFGGVLCTVKKPSPVSDGMKILVSWLSSNFQLHQLNYFAFAWEVGLVYLYHQGHLVCERQLSSFYRPG